MRETISFPKSGTMCLTIKSTSQKKGIFNGTLNQAKTRLPSATFNKNLKKILINRV